MTSGEHPALTPSLLEKRRNTLAGLLEREDAMLMELGRIVGVEPPGLLRDAASGQLGKVATFIDSTDFSSATEDARIWLLNRLGLYLARCFVERHGGRLTLQTDPSQRFHLHFVVTGMQPPVAADARLDPFAIAADAIHALPRCALLSLVQSAEQALVPDAERG